MTCDLPAVGGTDKIRRIVFHILKIVTEKELTQLWMVLTAVG